MSSWIRRQEGAVAVLTLKRPPVNTLDIESLDELAAALDEVKHDQETRVLVITGGIDGIFCAGGDLKCLRRLPNGKEVGRAGGEVFDKLEKLSKPTIAAINGQVIGDGLTLALACDFRIATEETVFRLPEVAYGFIPGWGLISRLVSITGRANAAELLLTGQPLEVTQAWVMGLVNQVVKSHELLDQALKHAAKMATFSPAALSAAKCVLGGGNEKACFETVWGKKDWEEGIDAMLSKRAPVFESH